MAFHPEMERLQTTHGEKGIERSGDRADSVLQEREPVSKITVADHRYAADYV
jgi:hypothetical protein